jgi:beta-glucanase (GH16 family)
MMRQRLRTSVLALCAGIALAGCSGSDSDGDWQLVWEDEFEGAAGTLPSAANWRFDIGTDWGNAQLEYDTNRPSNASLDGAGNLAIVARRESFQGSAYTSARITTKGRQQFQYGRIEGRIKLPVGQGIWPAFWMLGGNIDQVGWPQTGEIDIMEYRGQEPRVVLGSLHGPGYSGGQAITRRFELQQARFDDDFHVFSVEWSASRIDFRVDGSLYHSVEPNDVTGEWVFNHPFFIILNVAVGGTFVGAPSTQTNFPQTMLVDWVRVYQRAP